ncbi:MAG: ABC transporter permease [Azoarcus sp.]|jgi:putative ABC transport system permease protein|nr:ABC transporter permease [Azoarcus sp.]
MRATDILRFAARAALGYPLRTAMLVLAMAIGVAAVVALAAVGDGMRRYVVGQFASLGTNLVIMLPGRTETSGFQPGRFVTNTPRELTLDDAAALMRSPLVLRVAPLSVGSSEVAANGRLRDVTVLGTTGSFMVIRRLSLAQGRFLPEEGWQRAGAVAVIGATVHHELFDDGVAVGQTIRLGDRRLRVVGVMAPSGQGLDMNTDELVIVPVAMAQEIFNTRSLFRVLIETRGRDLIESAREDLARIMQARHDGELDVTLIAQDAVLSTFDNILVALTMSVAGIAAISLVVAGILVMNVMLVAVSQRTAEIGLLKALGAADRDIVRIFLTETALLSCSGALLGYGLGQAAAWFVRLYKPELPAWPPAWAVVAALGMALGSGLLFGVMPARRAAALDPILALARH